MGLELCKHERSSGLRRRVENRRREVLFTLGVQVFASTRARRGEHARCRYADVRLVVSTVLDHESILLHRPLANAELSHGHETRVRALVELSFGVVPRVQPLRVRRVKLILERRGVTHGKLHHAPLPGKRAFSRQRRRARRARAGEKAIRARRRPHPENSVFDAARIARSARSRRCARGLFRGFIDGHRDGHARAVLAVKRPAVVPARQRAVFLNVSQAQRRTSVRTAILQHSPLLARRVEVGDELFTEHAQLVRFVGIQKAHRTKGIPRAEPIERLPRRRRRRVRLRSRRLGRRFESHRASVSSNRRGPSRPLIHLPRRPSRRAPRDRARHRRRRRHRPSSPPFVARPRPSGSVVSARATDCARADPALVRVRAAGLLKNHNHSSPSSSIARRRRSTS